MALSEALAIERLERGRRRRRARACPTPPAGTRPPTTGPSSSPPASASACATTPAAWSPAPRRFPTTRAPAGSRWCWSIRRIAIAASRRRLLDICVAVARRDGAHAGARRHARRRRRLRAAAASSPASRSSAGSGSATPARPAARARGERRRLVGADAVATVSALDRAAGGVDRSAFWRALLGPAGRPAPGARRRRRRRASAAPAGARRSSGRWSRRARATRSRSSTPRSPVCRAPSSSTCRSHAARARAARSRGAASPASGPSFAWRSATKRRRRTRARVRARRPGVRLMMAASSFERAAAPMAHRAACASGCSRAWRSRRTRSRSTPSRRLDRRRQRALARYYLDAGAGGLAVGVHTTQFAIREAGLFEEVLTLAAETARDWPRLGGAGAPRAGARRRRRRPHRAGASPRRGSRAASATTPSCSASRR